MKMVKACIKERRNRDTENNKANCYSGSRGGKIRL